jgi:hypothetical protein
LKIYAIYLRLIGNAVIFLIGKTNIFVKWSNKKIVVNVEVFYIGMRVGFAMIVS